jgi:hypothetical protein
MAIAPSSVPPLDVGRAPEGGEVGAIQSGWRLAVREFASNKLAVVGVAILVFFVLFCFAGPLIYHGDVLNTNLNQTLMSPGAGHPLGTDDEGLDVLGELMKGGQASLEVGFFSALIAIGIGALYGALSGLVGGLLDSVLMRIVDVLLAIPFLFVVLIIAVRYGATVLSLSLIIGGFSWQAPSRLVRGEVLTLRAPAAERARRDSSHCHVPGRPGHPGGRRAWLPRVRAALPEPGLGRHAVQRHHLPGGRLLVAGLPGRGLHRPGRHRLHPDRRRAARLARCPAASPMRGRR